MRARLKLLELRLRHALPRPVRQLYRVTRSVTVAARVPAALPPALLDQCEMCATRVHMLDKLPKGGIVAELGTDKGAFAREILARVQPSELHLIDLTMDRLDQVVAQDPRVTCHQGTTVAEIGRFPDAHFDWIYIDADHAYDGVTADATASAPKLKPGGLLIFNDFAHIDPHLGRYGVHTAVVDFAVQAGWSLRYFAYEPSALYDVALRKPSNAGN